MLSVILSNKHKEKRLGHKRDNKTHTAHESRTQQSNTKQSTQRARVTDVSTKHKGKHAIQKRNNQTQNKVRKSLKHQPST